jgi:TATA-box binding protein (TBP) (component of TFIID and TFIIIB)
MQYISNVQFDASVLPKELNISTMSIILKLGTKIDIEKIITPPITPPISNSSKLARQFYNSVSLKIPVYRDDIIKHVHCKVFKNGSVHGAGFKNINEINSAINSAITYNIKPQSETDTIIVSDARIIMINTNFRLNFGVNREKLFQLLLRDGVVCFYDKLKHAAVRLHLPIIDKKKPIVIFVFEKGSILITGCTNHDHIIKGYLFITELVQNYESHIKKIVHNVKSYLFTEFVVRSSI